MLILGPNFETHGCAENIICDWKKGLYRDAIWGHLLNGKTRSFQDQTFEIKVLCILENANVS